MSERPAATCPCRSASQSPTTAAATPISEAACAQPSRIANCTSRSAAEKRQSDGPVVTVKPARRSDPAPFARRRGRALGRILVGKLMPVDRGDDLIVVPARGREHHPPVIGERRVERAPQSRECRHQAIEPRGGDEIEQRRHRHEIGRAADCGFEIARQIDCDGRAPSRRRGARAGEKRGVIVDETPALTRRQEMRDRP